MNSESEMKKTLKEVYSKKGLVIGCFKLVKLSISLIRRNIIWIYHKITSKDGIIIRNIQGSKLLLDLNGVNLDLFETNLFKQLAVADIREPVATEYLKKILKKGDTIVELGANIGYYATLESKIVGNQGHIIAIEPDSKNISILKKNITLNDFSKSIEVHQLAISDKNGIIKFYISDRCNWHGIIEFDRAHMKKHVEVESRTLDSLLNKEQKIDFIRMDIEGAEVEAIKGMQEVLRRNTNIKLFIELHPQNRKNPKEMIDMLKNLKNLGFQTTKVISFDTHIKKILGLTEVKYLTINELINDKGMIGGEHAFEVFFEKRNEKEKDNTNLLKD